MQVDVHQHLQLLGLFCFGFYFFYCLSHILTLFLSLSTIKSLHTQHTFFIVSPFCFCITGGQNDSRNQRKSWISGAREWRWLALDWSGDLKKNSGADFEIWIFKIKAIEISINTQHKHRQTHSTTDIFIL